MTNRDLSELLARAAASEEPRSQRQRALRNAARAALTWDEEAAALAGAGRPLTELRRVGPWIARMITDLSDAAASPVVFDPLRRDFLTTAEVHGLLAQPSAPPRRCDFQMHTTWSDGHSTLEEMVAACAGRGYTHFAITDHSKGLRIANGMDEERLAAQGRLIDAINARSDAGEPHVLRGMEVNLSPEGELDMDHATLATCDIVLGAFHSKLRLVEDQTERYLAAIRNPALHVLAHPRGRMFDRRLGLTADWRAVFEEASRLDKAVEIDGYIDRQDLNVELLAIARDCGVRVSLGSDAHHVVDLDYIDFSWAAATAAGIPHDRIINLLSLDGLRGWIESLRRRLATRSATR